MSSRVILKDANVYRSSISMATKECIVVNDGYIEAIIPEGDSSLIEYSGSELSLDGLTILPGLYDSHIHILQYSQSIDYVDCDTPSLNECLGRVRDKTKTTETGSWIIGHGWDQNRWARLGTRDDLDNVSEHHPIFLTSRSLHSAWVNSKALSLARIDQSTPDPEGGIILRTNSNLPTGILLEKAVDIVSNIIPAPSTEDAAELIKIGQQRLWQFGLVGVHNYDRKLSFQALQLLHRRGELGLRILQSLPLDSLPSALSIGLQQGIGDEWLKIGSVKLFMDGALGPHTAAMQSPYENEPENSGVLLINKDELISILRTADAANLPLSIHAIGDLANRVVLDAIEQYYDTSDSPQPKGSMHRIEHAQLLRPEDISRFSTLNVAASMQPLHATSDMAMAEENWGTRCKYAYAWKSLLQADAVLLFGSDAPVESPNPFLGIHAAVTRRRIDGSPDENGWIPAQKLSLSDALHAYTQAPSEFYVSRKLKGILEPTLPADLIVLKEDPFKVQPHELKDISPSGTMVGGKWRYRTF